MNKWINTIEEVKKEMSLSHEEKRVLRDSVLSFMSTHPVEAIPSPYVKRSPFAVRSLVAVRRFHFAPVALILVLLLGSGLSAAAEETVPGDALYFIKTSINESVKGWLALSEEAKVNLEAQIAETRLEEAEKLAADKKLSPEVKTELASKFKTHANNVKAGVKALESQGKLDTAAGVSSKFESSLNAHEDVLLSLDKKQGGETESSKLTKAFAENVKTEARGMAVVRADLEEKVRATAGASATTTEASALEAQLIAKESISTLSGKLADASKKEVTPEILATAYTHLSLATSTMALADTKMGEKNFAEAFILYQKAHRIAGEVQITFDAEQKLNIKVVSDLGPDLSGTSTATSTATTTITTGGGGVVKGTSTVSVPINIK